MDDPTNLAETSVQQNSASPVAGVWIDGGVAKAPQRVVRSITDARSCYDQMRVAHGPRLKRFAKIQGMIDGNPYYNPAALKKKGLNISNVNWKDAEAIYESVALVFWSLIEDVGHLAKFETDISTPENNAQIGRIVSEEWDSVVRSWRQFATKIQQHQGDLVKFGSSFFYWPDEKNWQFEVIDTWKILVPEDTRNETDCINLCAIEIVMSPVELWEIHENDAPHWDKKQIGEVLSRLSYTGNDAIDHDQNWMKIQSEIRSGARSITDILNKDIHLVCLLSREYNGKISKVIFHPSAGSGYLFEINGQYESISECLLYFPLIPGEKFIHHVRGIGHKIYNLIEGLTKLDGHIFDAAKAASTVFISSKATREKDGRRLKMDYGGIVDIGDAEFQQSLIGSAIGQQVEVAQYFRSKLEANCNIYTISGMGAGALSSQKRSATEIAQIARREARVQKNLISLYYQNLDFLYREMVRKMLLSTPTCKGYEFVKMWKARCISRGVPEEFFTPLNSENSGFDGLPMHMRVSATRAAGSGSQLADQIEMKDMMTMMPLLGERGREAVIADAIAATRGHSYVERYRPPADISKEPIAEDCLADGENVDMESGIQRIVSPDNNHAVHAQRHMERMRGIAQKYQEKAYDLLDADAAFSALGPHFTRHLLYLSRDHTREDLTRSLGAQWRVIANFADMIKNNAQAHREAELEKMQKAAQEAATANTMNDPAMVKVVADNQRKMLKLQEDIRRNALRDQNKFMLDRMKLTYEAEIEQAKAMQEMAIKRLETAQNQVSGKGESELF